MRQDLDLNLSRREQEPARESSDAADVIRLRWSSGNVSHCRYPAWEAEEIESVSAPGSIGVPFMAQRRAVVRHGGRSGSVERDVAVASVGLCGADPIHWVRTPSPSDTVEITAVPALRRDVAAAMGVPQHADLADVDIGPDPVVRAAALRWRAACRGWLHLSDLARDEMLRALYAHVLRTAFGGRWPRRLGVALDRVRLERSLDCIEANLAGDLTIARLADAAATSPFHFAHAFKAATGLPPHRFVTVLRLERAAERLRRGGATVERAAHESGFENLSHFRRAFHAQYGCSPSALAPVAHVRKFRPGASAGATLGSGPIEGSGTFRAG